MAQHGRDKNIQIFCCYFCIYSLFNLIETQTLIKHIWLRYIHFQSEIIKIFIFQRKIISNRIGAFQAYQIGECKMCEHLIL